MAEMAETPRTRRWLKRVALVLLLLVVVVPAAGAFLLIRTQPGLDFVLRVGLGQARRFVDGEVSVGALRSDGLLRGFTLHDVSIADSRGRPFVDVDSLRVRYSVSDLLHRDLVLVPVDVWGPRIVIETLHGDERSNVSRIFGGEREPSPDTTAAAIPGEPADTLGAQESPSSGRGWLLALRRTAIHGGGLLLRLPVGEDAERGRGVFETVDEGRGAGAYRVLRFENVDARISNADLVASGERARTLGFDELSLVGYVFADPFTVSDLSGDAVLEGSGLRLALDRLKTPGSELSGDVRLAWGGPGPLEIEADVDAPQVAFEDFQWLEPRLPRGGGRMALRVSGPLDRSEWRITDADVEVGGSRVRGRAGLDLGNPVRFSDTELRAEPLRVRDLDPWLSEPLPFDGELRGSLRAEGPLNRLALDGHLSIADPEKDIPASEADVEGTLGLGETVRVSDLNVTVDPLRYETLVLFLPDLSIRGTGHAHVTATGALDSGVQVSAEIKHSVGGGPTSSVSLSGAVRRGDRTATVALAGTLDPLSMDGLSAALGRDLPVSGDVSGSLVARGPLSDIALSGSLQTAGGAVDASASLDVGDPLRSYRFEGAMRDFRAHLVVDGLPEPTVVTGDVIVDGAGGDLDSVRGQGTLRLDRSRVGRVDVDAVRASVRAIDGRLLVDTLEVASRALSLSGSGDLALGRDEPPGRLSLVWAADSLSTLRPLVFGDEEIVPDTLTQLEREVLRVDGIDPDTLQASTGLALEGAAHGEATLRGGVRDLEGDGFAEMMDVKYGSSSLARARADLKGRWHASDAWGVDGVVDFDSLYVVGFQFERGEGGVSYGPDGGDFDLSLQGRGEEGYAAAGMLARDSAGLGVGLQSMSFRAADVDWELQAPATIRFEGSAIRTDGLRLAGTPQTGTGEGRPSIAVGGVLNLDGDSDLEVNVVTVELGSIGKLVQREPFPTGVVTLDLTVRGPADAPRIDGEIGVTDPSFRGATLSSLDGTLEYADRTLRGRLTGTRDGARLVEIDGTVPVDLAFRSMENRFTERDMNLTIAANSLPAATALAMVRGVEDVEGTIDGEIHLLGPRDDLKPSGEIRLSGGTINVPDLGLRATAIGARFRVRPDLAVEVEADARARGRAVITGTVSLDKLLDPSFDLEISASGFQAVERRDLTARLGGDMTLTGSYSAPRVGGRVAVEQGELSLEEFIRGAEVIDLSDPRFFDVVDTSLVTTRPVIGAQNPFMQNLRVDVALSLEQDFWIRSRERTQGMDVEIGGDLTVNYDRPQRELVLVGTLEANRGSYSQFGRQFEVQSGDLEFPGTPGIDPSLDIQAVYRLRREGAEPLNIIANVAGTLRDPQVTLTSDAQPAIPESDLISYLIFGRPSYALASRETSVVEDALASVVSAGINFGVSGLGATVSRSLGLDYVAISQTQQAGMQALNTWSQQFADTQIEVGRYVGDEVFLSLALRPLTGLAPERRTQLPSVRLEWTFKDYWSMEGFLEDRLVRQGTVGFSELDNRSKPTFGISLFREWGY